MNDHNCVCFQIDMINKLKVSKNIKSLQQVSFLIRIEFPLQGYIIINGEESSTLSFISAVAM
jgi:hypothetical protein